jgi:hypothetical protein
MSTAPQDQNPRIQDLIVLTERLTALIAQQAQAFEQRRPQDAALNMEETTKLANAYRHEAAKMRANPAEIAAAPLDQRRRLIRATEAFDAVIARQGRALTAAKTITEGLVHAIAHEVAAHRNKGAAYGPNGVRSGAAVTAITLNQRA